MNDQPADEKLPSPGRGGLTEPTLGFTSKTSTQLRRRGVRDRSWSDRRGGVDRDRSSIVVGSGGRGHPRTIVDRGRIGGRGRPRTIVVGSGGVVRDRSWSDRRGSFVVGALVAHHLDRRLHPLGAPQTQTLNSQKPLVKSVRRSLRLCVCVAAIWVISNPCRSPGPWF